MLFVKFPPWGARKKEEEKNRTITNRFQSQTGFCLLVGKPSSQCRQPKPAALAAPCPLSGKKILQCSCATVSGSSVLPLELSGDKTRSWKGLGSSFFRYPSLLKNLALLTIFVAKTRYRHLRVKDFPSHGSKIRLLSLRSKSFRAVQGPVFEKTLISRGRQNIDSLQGRIYWCTSTPWYDRQVGLVRTFSITPCSSNLLS